MREQFDLRVYVDTPPDVCLARRILRDTRERGRSVESVIDQPTRFGFVYATLPDHPEQGYESFIVNDVDGEITWDEFDDRMSP